MRSAFSVFALMGLISSAHAAVDIDVLRANLEKSNAAMNEALGVAREACGGISADLEKLKNLAGAGTGVSAAGLATGGTAVATGVIKANTDETLKSQTSTSGLLNSWTGGESLGTIGAELRQKLLALFDRLKAEGGLTDKSLQQYRQESELGQKSKTLGDVRTGTLAATAALNVAGAAVSGADLKRGGALSERVTACLDATKALNTAWGQVRINKMSYESGLSQLGKSLTDAENVVVSNVVMTRVENAVKACDEWSTVDLSKIDNKAKGALASNIIGATAGIAGTATSAMANTDSMRFSATAKEKNLNTASNVMAGGAAVASGVATIFNATQISTIKRASTVANACEGALN